MACLTKKQDICYFLGRQPAVKFCKKKSPSELYFQSRKQSNLAKITESTFNPESNQPAKQFNGEKSNSYSMSWNGCNFELVVVHFGAWPFAHRAFLFATTAHKKPQKIQISLMQTSLVGNKQGHLCQTHNGLEIQPQGCPSHITAPWWHKALSYTDP